MAPQKTWLDRALSVVTEVRSGEGVGALILAVSIFSVLIWLEIVAIVRDHRKLMPVENQEKAA